MRPLVLVLVALVATLAATSCKKKEPSPPPLGAAAPAVFPAPRASPAAPAPGAAPAPPAAPAVAGYKPRYAQRMFEVALRFHLAGKSVEKGNWDYATHQATELFETFKNDLPNVLPATNVPPGVDIKGLRAQFTNAQLVALVDAAKKRDKKGWDAAYVGAAAGCNSCHAQVGKQFIAIQAKPGNTFEDIIGLQGAK